MNSFAALSAVVRAGTRWWRPASENTESRSDEEVRPRRQRGIGFHRSGAGVAKGGESASVSASAGQFGIHFSPELGRGLLRAVAEAWRRNSTTNHGRSFAPPN